METTVSDSAPLEAGNRRNLSRYTPLNLYTATERLLEMSRSISQRNKLRPVERRRIKNAFELLDKPRPRTTKRYKVESESLVFWPFLKQVHRVGGREMVILFAATLTPSCVLLMAKEDRALLPFDFKIWEPVYKTALFAALDQSFRATERRLTRIDTVAGDVYQLTQPELHNLVLSSHLRGNICLTNPYGLETSPFITITIPRELIPRVTAQRPADYVNARSQLPSVAAQASAAVAAAAGYEF